MPEFYDSSETLPIVSRGFRGGPGVAPMTAVLTIPPMPLRSSAAAPPDRTDELMLERWADSWAEVLDRC